MLTKWDTKSDRFFWIRQPLQDFVIETGPLEHVLFSSSLSGQQLAMAMPVFFNVVLTYHL